MTGDRPVERVVNEDGWAEFFAHVDHAGPRAWHWLARHLPSDPRCKVCAAPFRGWGGRVVRPLGFTQSRKNPTLCARCCEEAPLGGVELDVGVFFADVRGFTSLTERSGSRASTELLNRFYRHATRVLSRHAVIDKMIGDEVMALFVPPLFGGGDAPRLMIECARDLLRALAADADAGPTVDVGIGLDWGRAFVGNVGTDDVKDFTAIGDVVNTASRLTGEARAGQVVVSERLFQLAGDALPKDLPSAALDLKGKAERVPVRFLTP